MPDIELAAIFVLAAFVHGAFGFGFPLLSTPLLALTMDLRAAILLTLIPTISVNLFSILHETHWREALRTYWAIPTFTILGSSTGTQILLSVDPTPFKLLLALVMLGYLVSERLKPAAREHRVPNWGMAIFGFSLGMLAGVVNIFAPVVVVYALYTRMQPALMVATFNTTFITSKSGQLLGFAINDALTMEGIAPSLIVLPIILLALWLGIKVRHRIKVETYRNLLRFALWVITVGLVFDAHDALTGKDL